MDNEYGTYGQQEDTAQENLKAISGVNKGYKETLDKTKLGDDIREHYSDVADITKRTIALETYYKDSERVRGEINLLSNLIGLSVIQREAFIKQMQARRKSEEFSNRLKDKQVVDKDDYLLLERIIEMDQYIQPMLALMGQAAIYGFESAGGLVRVDVVIKESDRLLKTVGDIVVNAQEQAKDMIKNTKEISDSVVDNANKRQDEDIKEIRLNANTIIREQIKRDGMIDELERRIATLEGYSAKKHTILASDSKKEFKAMLNDPLFEPEQSQDSQSAKPPTQAPPRGTVFNTPPTTQNTRQNTREHTINQFVVNYHRSHESFQGLHPSLIKEFDHISPQEQKKINELQANIKRME